MTPQHLQKLYSHLGWDIDETDMDTAIREFNDALAEEEALEDD